LITPEAAIGAGVDELGADDELISALYDTSRDHTFDFEIFGHGLEINVPSLVVKDRRAGHNREIWNLRRLLIKLSVRPSLRYSLLGSLPD
jgi:hypothetical protein